MTHITRIAASRTYEALGGVQIVLDPGHGGKSYYPTRINRALFALRGELLFTQIHKYIKN